LVNEAITMNFNGEPDAATTAVAGDDEPAVVAEDPVAVAEEPAVVADDDFDEPPHAAINPDATTNANTGAAFLKPNMRNRSFRTQVT
jgi:hypothetical protein